MEALVSLAITLVVLGVVFRTVQMLVAIYERESEIAEKNVAATRAFGDIAVEIARGGYGLGEGVQAVLPYLTEGSTSPSEITIRSNDDGVAAVLGAELTASGQSVRVSASELFNEGDKILLTEAGGFSERAEITAVGENELAFRSLDGEDGELLNSYSPDRGARVLKLVEVGYSLEPAPEGTGNLLRKHSFDRTPRVLARNIHSLRFEYLDAEGRPLSDDSLERTDLLATVRITMTFSIGPTPNDERTLATAVTLDR